MAGVGAGGPAARPPSPPPAPPLTGTLACTLDPSGVTARVEEWHALLCHVTRRLPLADGVRLELSDATPMAELARLVAAERSCCGFFAFTITVDDRGLGLEVRAPADAQPVVAGLFGAAA